MADMDNFLRIIQIPIETVGIIIGVKGETAQHIQTKTNCLIDVSTVRRGPYVSLYMKGTDVSIEQAKAMIYEIIAQNFSVRMKVPSTSCGYVIGKNGKNIQKIEQLSRASIVFSPIIDNWEREIQIKGTKEQIETAISLLKVKIAESENFFKKFQVPAPTPDQIEDRLRTIISPGLINLRRRLSPFEVYISSVTHPGKFWFQVAKYAMLVKGLTTEMTKFYSDPESRVDCVLHDVKVGQLVAAPGIHDCTVYSRAKVASIQSASGENVELMLHYVDYGYFGRCNAANVFRLTDSFLNRRFQAIEGSLAGVKPIANGAWCEKATTIFKHLTYDQLLKAVVVDFMPTRGFDNNLVPRIKLFRSYGGTDTEIASILVAQGLLVVPFPLATMVLKLYGVSDSPPSLAVRMALSYFQQPLEYIEVDFESGEHLSEEFGNINPQHEVPVLDDDGFQLSESVAILQYLNDKYGKERNSLRTDREKALINHRLAFCLSTYYRYIAEYAVGPIFYGYERTDIALKKVKIGLQVFETYLKKLDSKYAAGNELTVADFSLVAATLCLEAISFDLSEYPKMQTWYENFKVENANLWKIAEGGMLELRDYNRNPPNLDHLNHPFHPKKKV